MMNFSFGQDQNFVSNSKAQLKGGDIYKVKFLSAEMETFEGKQDSTKGQTFKVFNIKFENEEGYYTETIFEPRESDYERRSNDFNGQIFLSPSRSEEIQLIMIQLIEALIPGSSKQLIGKTINSFDQLCKVISKIVEPAKGKETNLKLILDKKGKARLPFLGGLTKENKLFPRTNYIGENLFFTDKELSNINSIKESTPTDTESFIEKNEAKYDTQQNDNDDLDWDI